MEYKDVFLYSVASILVVLAIHYGYRGDCDPPGPLVLLGITSILSIIFSAFIFDKTYICVDCNSFRTVNQKNRFHQELTTLLSTLILIHIAISGVIFTLFAVLWVYNPGNDSIDAGRTGLGLVFLVFTVYSSLLYLHLVILPLYNKLKSVREL